MNQRAQKQRAPMKRSTRLALITIASLMGLALVTWGAIVLALANKDLPAEEAEERRRATNQGQIRYATYDPQIEPKDLMKNPTVFSSSNTETAYLWNKGDPGWSTVIEHKVQDTSYYPIMLSLPEHWEKVSCQQ